MRPLAVCLVGTLFLAWLSLQTQAVSSKWTEENFARRLLQGVSLLLGQKYESELLTPAEFEQLALTDSSNDEIILSSRQEIIERSGFKYENFESVSSDGYITQLIHLINPLAERRFLKGPPVMLLQGGISDQTIWIWGSARQHHPERWPRARSQGPITSWNRSLAFTLANNGYDVWLIGSRGSNADNRAHLKYDQHRGSKRGSPFKQSQANISAGLHTANSDLGDRDLLERLRYWDYSMDELALHELPAQIDQVLQLTGAQNVTLVPVSFSGTYTPMAFAESPEYLRKLHNLVAVGPIVNGAGTNAFWKLFQRTLCKLIPSELGNLVFNEFLFADTIRVPQGRLYQSHKLRYSLLKATSLVLNGASARFQTFFEPAVMSNIFTPTSFKEIKHFCQVATAGRLQKFDYGPLKNKRLYGTLAPRHYQTDRLDWGTWLMVSAQNDALAPAASISDFIGLSKTPPVEHVSIAHYNHVDLLAAFDNDLKVNLPILQFLDRFHLTPPTTTTATAHQHPQASGSDKHAKLERSKSKLESRSDTHTKPAQAGHQEAASSE